MLGIKVSCAILPLQRFSHPQCRAGALYPAVLGGFIDNGEKMN